MAYDPGVPRTVTFAALAALALLVMAAPAWAQKTRPVKIGSVPEGATVHVGDTEGEPLGVTPLEAELPPGEHTLIFELDGHVPVFETLIVDAIKDRKKARVPVTMKVALVPAISTLVVRGDVPADARVRVDGKDRGGLPLRLQVEPGAHQVEVLVPGRQPYEEWVDLEGGQEHEVTVSLAALVPDEAPTPKRPVGPRPPAAVARLGVDVSWRRFRYDDPGDDTFTPPFDANARVMGRFEAELAPWRLAPAAWRLWPLSLVVGVGFSPEDTAVRGAERANFNHRQFDAGLRYRLGLGDTFAVGFDVGWTRLLYDFAGSLEYALPDVDYNVVRLGVRGEARLGPVRPWLGVENRLVAGSGELGDRFRSADADGLALHVGALARLLGERAELGAAYELVRFGWAFEPVDSMPSYVASGASDTFHALRVWVGGAY